MRFITEIGLVEAAATTSSASAASRQAVGLGPISAASTPTDKKRRVTVKVTVDQD